MDFETERRNVGEGWQPLLEDLHAKLLALDPRYEIQQIKEKFGGLRYYISPSESLDGETWKQIQDLTAEAELKSYVICEDCGEPGNQTTDSRWIRTLCVDCKTKAGRS